MESASIERNGNRTFPVKEEIKSPTDHIMNGLSNGIGSKSDGHHKHKHKDKEKNRHGDKHKHKDKDKDRVRESHSSRDKPTSDRRNDERRDKEHRDRDEDPSKNKEHRNKDKDSHDKVRDKDNDKNKENRNKALKTKDHSSDSNKYRDSSHKSKDDKHSGSSSSKSHSSSCKEKDKHHSGNKDKHKDKHSSSSKHSSSDKATSSSSCEISRHKDSLLKVEPEHLSASIKKKENNVQFKESVVKSEQLSDDEADGSRRFDNIYMKEEPSTFNEDSIEPADNDPLDPFDQDDESEDSIPLAKRTSMASKRKRMASSGSEEDIPLSARKKVKKEDSKKRKKPINTDDEECNVLCKPKVKERIKKEVKQEARRDSESPKKKKKDDEDQNVWKWWEEEKKDDGVKWKFLEHKGPMFAPAYERLPKEVKFYYSGKEMKLSQDAEEIATFYARLIEHEYTTKEKFNKNFFKDWRRSMSLQERQIITDLSKCNFRPMYEYFVKKSEERKAMSKEEKKKIKEENEEIAKLYGVCVIDGHKEKIGNFKIEPPGLFRGRGEHPKMGLLKKRVMPEDVIINCSQDSKKPVPPENHKWKEIRHDNTVTWLASWTENVQGQVKYVMLNPSSKLKGEKDWQKYETARKLAKCVDKIRQDYREDWKSKEMRIRQRAVAMYFIDKLALRAGNEKDEDQADTVGCCSLRVEHIELIDQQGDQENIVVFDFLGKDSIRYYNEVPVEKRVYKNLKLFREGKKGSDDLFDRLNTAVLNKYLNELMNGLSAKVFRTYNASITLQNQLKELTDPCASIPEKILQYNRANRAVAVLCNHQRSVPKSHEKSMGNLKSKIDAKKEQVAEAQKQYKEAKREAKGGSAGGKIAVEKKKKALERLKEQLMKLEVQETDKEENKTIALGTSKLNYLDPRISVAWCKKYGVPIEKVYNKTQRSKFRWAIDMVGPEFVF